MIPNVTIMATRISSPIGKNKPNNASPSLSAKIHMYATDMMATANQQLTTIAALDSIFLTPRSLQLARAYKCSIDPKSIASLALSGLPHHRFP